MIAWFRFKDVRSHIRGWTLEHRTGHGLKFKSQPGIPREVRGKGASKAEAGASSVASVSCWWLSAKTTGQMRQEEGFCRPHQRSKTSTGLKHPAVTEKNRSAQRGELEGQVI